ncbi:MAG: hypothetical protein WCP20_13000 [Desulfuromonadales bacterium]
MKVKVSTRERAFWVVSIYAATSSLSGWLSLLRNLASREVSVCRIPLVGQEICNFFRIRLYKSHVFPLCTSPLPPPCR